MVELRELLNDVANKYDFLTIKKSCRSNFAQHHTIPICTYTNNCIYVKNYEILSKKNLNRKIKKYFRTNEEETK